MHDSSNQSSLDTDNPRNLDEFSDEVLNTTANLLDPTVHFGDFKKVVELMYQRVLSDDKKYYLLIRHFTPTNFHFLIMVSKNTPFSIVGLHITMV